MNFVSGLMIAMNSKNKENSKKLSVQKTNKRTNLLLSLKSRILSRF